VVPSGKLIVTVFDTTVGRGGGGCDAGTTAGGDTEINASSASELSLDSVSGKILSTISVSSWEICPHSWP
jgi:hypothetical protein